MESEGHWAWPGASSPPLIFGKVLWAIDGASLVAASALLTVKYLRKGNDCVAAGFLVFSIGQSLILAGAAADLAASVPSFAAGVTLWAAALLLTSIPKEFATWIRLVGAFAAMLFLITAGRIFCGEQLLPTFGASSGSLAYPFFVITIAGWIWSLMRGDRLEVTPAKA